MSDPKNHHYLPQFYLKGFCRDEKIWVHDRQEYTYKELLPKSVGAEKHRYAFTDKDGERDVSAEKELSRIEGAAAPVIRKLDCGQQITFKERCDLALFVALMRYRVPDFEQEHEEWHDTVIKDLNKRMFPTVTVVKAHMARYGDEPDEEAAQNIFQMLHDENYDVVTNKPYYISQMIGLGLNTAEQLANMNWVLLQVPKKAAFITSDKPFLLVPPPDYDPSEPYGVGIITEGAQKCLPLTKNLFLSIQDEGLGIEIQRVGRPTVRSINQTIAKHHLRFLFGSDEALLRKAASSTTPSPRARPAIGDTHVFYKGSADKN